MSETVKKKRKRSDQLTFNSKVINEHFQCAICEGYIIDAATISECLHSFCKSCIYTFIKDVESRCPICNLNDISQSIK